MTWTARATVEEVAPGPAPVVVRAVARASDAMPIAHVTIPCVSFTQDEGRIREIEVLVTFDVDDPGLRPGDVLIVNGRCDV